ncbi:MAG: 50S ribosomal protein L3 N(5)-glutamine methyltransferase [Burkholderiales bacterium]|nr:50S ribosomal protein L3 N(5)-glutamine methyltransferase [Burkholderiales bacterium]
MFKQAKTQLTTPRDLLRFAISRFNEADLFFGHGCLNALDEAAYLILHALHLPHDRLDPFLDAKLLQQEVESVLQLIEQRIVQRVPAAYLTHEAWLGDFKFYVDERVIVPRSFIAELLREQLSPWVADPENVTSALDLCTGSGCLAILLAHAFPRAQVDAVDLSPDALDVARRNISDYGLAQQVTPIESDLFKALQNRTYDVIVSNPPYVDQAAMAALPQEYQHEPKLALASGQDGLDHVRVILKDAPEHLKPGGVLVVELGHHRLALEAAFPGIEFTWPEMPAGTDCVFIITREQLSRQ